MDATRIYTEQEKQQKVKQMENETRPRKTERTLNISCVEVFEGKDEPGSVGKISFITDGGSITWKPKVDRSVYQEGFKVTTQTKATMDELPDNVKEMAKTTTEKGFCNVKAVYMVWDKMQDGQPVQIVFVNGFKQMLQWEIIKEEIKQEAVETPPSFY